MSTQDLWHKVAFSMALTGKAPEGLKLCQKEGLIEIKDPGKITTTHEPPLMVQHASTHRVWLQIQRDAHDEDPEMPEAWRCFKGFFQDMGPRPRKGLLRRRDPSQAWSPENAYWDVAKVS